MIDLDQLIVAFSQRGIGWEASVLLACLAAAYGICWLTGRRQPPDSVLFGRHLFDGVLFPLLALAFTYSARVALGDVHRVPLLRLAVPVLVSLAVIRLVARVLLVVFPDVSWARVVERLVSWLAWIAAVLWMLGLLPAVMDEMEAIRFSFGKSKVSLLAMVQGLLSSGLVMVVVLWISAAVERKFLRSAVSDLSLRKVAANAIRAVLLLVGFLFALSVAGVDLTALSVLGGAIGVGLGFGLQKLASKTRYTLIRSLSGTESVVPNEKLITERIENLSLADPRVLLTTEVSVDYDCDVDVAQRVLLDATRGALRVIADPAPAVRLARFGPDGLEFSVLFWISDPQNGQLAVKSDVNLRILKGLREAGIAIPYPQRVVHVTSSGTAATG